MSMGSQEEIHPILLNLFRLADHLILCNENLKI